jgi:hypothetical protein
MEQSTINELGERIPKHRMTHDQSFPGPSLLSVNLRVIKEQLPQCMYSFVLLRTLHYIIDIRTRYPSTPIYISKFDLDAAYRRCHLAGTTATECLTVHNNMLLMALRMTFGGAPCPALWGYISDTVADLGNAQIQDLSWDHTKTFDPISAKLPLPTSSTNSTHFKKAQPLIVTIPPNNLGKVDVYLDDFITVTPDLDNNCARVNNAIPLAIHSIACPLDPINPMPRKDIIAMKKFLAEGKLEERKIVLGWEIDTRSLIVSLPQDKFIKWNLELEKLLSAKRVNKQQLEISLGRINHLANIMPTIRHFLGRLYHALARASKHHWTSLTLHEKLDLHLTQKFLHEAASGVSINNIVFRKPSIIYRSDASEFGIGGYNVTTGMAWRYEINTKLRLHTTLNSLEFIACVLQFG